MKKVMKKQEIRFRVWDRKKKRFLSPYGISVGIDIADCDLLLYVGVKDKNGREIYKGDILELIDVNNERTGEISVVIFQNGAFLNPRVEDYNNYFLKGKDLTATYAECVPWLNYGDDLEIIGTVYENPELLKEK